MRTEPVVLAASRPAIAGRAASAVLVLLAAGAPVIAAADTELPQIVPVAPGIHMLVGGGGNVGVASGVDRTFVIDDQYANAAEALLQAIAQITSEPVSFVVNTHYHADHTGGNERFGDAGALIVAHDHVRKRISKEQFIEFLGMRSAAIPLSGLPVITFEHSLTFHLNGDEIDVVHVPRAHTDGDAFVHFRRANVIHAGDVFFNGIYPFIDFGAGGTIDGLIAACDQMLARADASTTIIPGHGPLSDAAGLRAYRDMLADVGARIRDALRSGSTLEQVLAAKPTADYDATWGGGFLPPARWVTMVYEGIRMQQ